MASGLGESQQHILEHLKRHGASTIPTIAADIGLNVETVRAHLRALAGDRLVRRSGSRARGPGRPEIVYELTPEAEPLFPNREGDLLRRFATYLEESGRSDLIRDFFADYVATRRADALERIEGLEGEARLRAVAAILSEDGFMAEIESREGRPHLKLCHCPMRSLVAATRAPCRAELGLVRELLGEKLARVSYIPSGDASCCYAVQEA